VSAKYAASGLFFVTAMVAIFGFDGDWRMLTFGAVLGIISTAFAFSALADD